MPDLTREVPDLEREVPDLEREVPDLEREVPDLRFSGTGSQIKWDPAKYTHCLTRVDHSAFFRKQLTHVQ